MNPQPVLVVQELYAAFARRDMPKIASLFSPEIEIVQSDELPWGGTYRGHAGAREFFGKLGTAINSTLEIERYISSADHVTAVGWTKGTVNTTGVAYRVPIAHVWRIVDGKAVRAQFLIDHPTMLAALRTA